MIICRYRYTFEYLSVVFYKKRSESVKSQNVIAFVINNNSNNKLIIVIIKESKLNEKGSCEPKAQAKLWVLVQFSSSTHSLLLLYSFFFHTQQASVKVPHPAFIGCWGHRMCSGTLPQTEKEGEKWRKGGAEGNNRIEGERGEQIGRGREKKERERRGEIEKQWWVFRDGVVKGIV